MPLKRCPNPNCDQLSGPRKLYCTCGQPFETTIAKASNNSTVVINNTFNVAPPPRPETTLRPQDYMGEYGTINTDPEHLFDDLYGKTDALSVVMSALSVYNQTDGKNRYHSLLIGGPSAGKTEICNRIEEMAGKDNVLRFNSESASKAGMENEILNYPTELPPLLIVEEIEKIGDPNTLLWMLPALDTRKEIIKITSREGMVRRKVPFICIGTCNDLSKLERMHSGSIASRFTNKLHIPDMDDDMRYQILCDKLKNLPNGDTRWIPPAIEFCRQINDLSMRKLESVLMCGQHRLLTGEYQATLLATSR